MASHVPRAAALKQALADEHQRKTELLKKQKRAGYPARAAPAVEQPQSRAGTARGRC